MRTILLSHSEIVKTIQIALFAQLQRDGRLHPDAEIGLMFYSDDKWDMHVDVSVMVHRRVLYGLKGDRRHICPPLTQLALSRLSPEERRRVAPGEAEVRFQNHRSEGPDHEDSFTAEVRFQERAVKAG